MTTTPTTAQRLAELTERLQEIADLRAAEALMSWDQQTYMPTKSAEIRGRQLGTLSALAHARLTDPRLGELLDELGAAELDEAGRAIVREVKRDRDRNVKLPERLVREMAETTARAHHVWVEARQARDFPRFAPLLTKIVELSQEVAEAVGYGAGVPYDALLDQYEPGATVAQLAPIIARARDIAVAAVQAINAAPRRPDVSILRRGYDAAGQEAFGRALLPQMGYDLEAGRLDVSAHPFTTNFSPRDVRITTRYLPDWLPSSVFGTIHEAGHALYEQGFSPEHYGTPLAEAVSLGIHESQSRFWENQIGRGRPFWEGQYPRLQRQFPAQLDGVNLDAFHFAVNAVQPSLIRVEADEVTYNLHIVVRWEIEQALFAGQIGVDELPGVWNDKMAAYLGVRPAHDGEGVLQDIHWSLGSFGYFPTYLLGNLYAAQWWATLRRELPDLDAMIARGEWLPIRDWHRRNIHVHGRRYTAAELVRRVSGELLNPDYFAAYLKERFASLYDVNW